MKIPRNFGGSGLASSKVLMLCLNYLAPLCRLVDVLLSQSLAWKVSPNAHSQLQSATNPVCLENPSSMNMVSIRFRSWPLSKWNLRKSSESPSEFGGTFKLGKGNSKFSSSASQFSQLVRHVLLGPFLDMLIWLSFLTWATKKTFLLSIILVV